MKTLFVWIVTALTFVAPLTAADEQTPPNAPEQNIPATPKYQPTYQIPKYLSPVFPMEDIIHKPTEQDDRFLTELFSMLATLGLIIAALLLVLWFMKRLMNTRVEQLNASSSIRISERRALSPKSMLYLIEVENKTILIAESINGITRIEDFPLIETSASESTPTEPTSTFSKLLDKKR